ncbi:tetratricopeptide repeat protein [Pseudanabaena yagii]|uniref:Tetratricopeptide repeat protein n=1 Tax=Pseudanabaena yagii GIHE-NHR1 TaxID=2722753 RepID=A0ABX1LUW0_9CYAN|nr:tetratricopeptide repeat protein [Pseudanabaena yagii]NMF59957.1 tetratricopeptide repeat protein [Pseudanabaena yagii GIHE-NHR1]
MAKSNQKIVVILIAFFLISGLALVSYFLFQQKTGNPPLTPTSEVSPTPKSEQDTKAQSFVNSGNDKVAKKDYKGAIADWSESIRLNPEYFLYYQKHDIAQKEKGGDPVVADYKQAISLKLDDAKAYCDRGLVKYTLGDYQGALEDWNEAIRLKPDFSLAYYNRGVVRYASGNMKDAIEDYNEAIKIDRNWGIRGLAAAYYNRGIAKSGLKDKQGEKADLKKAAELFKQQGNSEQYNMAVKALEKP